MKSEALKMTLVDLESQVIIKVFSTFSWRLMLEARNLTLVGDVTGMS